jgi:hypothetical protein
MLNLSSEEIKKKIQEQTEMTLEEINKRVEDKLTQLSGLISEEGALHIIANELDVQFVPNKEDRKIKDLLPGMRDIEQAVRIIQSYELRTFQSKYDDGVGKVKSMLVGDESGVIRVTAWGPRAEEADKLKEQDIMLVKNAYVKENNGRAELHLNNNSEIVANPEGVEVGKSEGRQEGGGEYVRRSINELSKGDYRVELLGTIVQAYDPRFFERKDGTEGFVTNIMIDDGTGNVRIGCFDDVAAKILGMETKEVMANKDGSFEEAKTQVLGEIVKVQGRAKLNTVYNSIDVTADSIDMSPDAKAELEKLQADGGVAAGQSSLESEKDSKEKKEDSKDTPEESAKEPAEEESTETEDDSASLDDMDDIAETQEDSEESAEEPAEESAKEKSEEKSDDSEEKKKKPKGDDAISLDDLDDLDFSDLDEK